MDHPKAEAARADGPACPPLDLGYHCSPLWDPAILTDGPLEFSDDFNLDPERVPISAELRADLLAWAAVADRIVTRAGGDRPEWTDAELEAHTAAGWKLAQRLSDEMAAYPRWRVDFHDSIVGKDLPVEPGRSRS